MCRKRQNVIPFWLSLSLIFLQLSPTFCPWSYIPSISMMSLTQTMTWDRLKVHELQARLWKNWRNYIFLLYLPYIIFTLLEWSEMKTFKYFYISNNPHSLFSTNYKITLRIRSTKGNRKASSLYIHSYKCTNHSLLSRYRIYYGYPFVLLFSIIHSPPLILPSFPLFFQLMQQ